MMTEIEEFKLESQRVAKARAFFGLVRMWWASANRAVLVLGLAATLLFSVTAMTLGIAHPSPSDGDGSVFLACGMVALTFFGYLFGEFVFLVFGRSLSWSDMFAYAASGGLLETLESIAPSDLMRSNYQARLNDIELHIEKMSGGIVVASFKIPTVEGRRPDTAAVRIRGLLGSNPVFRIEKKPDWCKKELTENLLRQFNNALRAWDRADVQRAKAVLDASTGDAM